MVAGRGAAVKYLELGLEGPDQRRSAQAQGFFPRMKAPAGMTIGPTKAFFAKDLRKKAAAATMFVNLKMFRPGASPDT